MKRLPIPLILPFNSSLQHQNAYGLDVSILLSLRRGDLFAYRGRDSVSIGRVRTSEASGVDAHRHGNRIRIKKIRFHHKEPSAAKPQPKIGISRAKAQRPQRKKCFPNLAFLASWRENKPKRLLLKGKNRR